MRERERQREGVRERERERIREWVSASTVPRSPLVVEEHPTAIFLASSSPLNLEPRDSPGTEENLGRG